MPRTILTPPAIDQVTIDRCIAAGKRERARFMAELARALVRAIRPAAASRREVAA